MYKKVLEEVVSETENLTNFEHLILSRKFYIDGKKVSEKDFIIEREKNAFLIKKEISSKGYRLNTCVADLSCVQMIHRIKNIKYYKEKD